MLESFVGVRLNRARNELGYIIERTSFADIFAPGIAFIDADVRGVSEDSVTICRFGGFGETIAFDDIDLIRVRRDGCRDEVLNLRRTA